MIKRFIILFLFLSVASFGQDKIGTIKVKKVEKAKTDTIKQLTASTDIIIADTMYVSQPLAIVEQMPIFPGGNNAMNQFMLDNFKYPDAEKKAGIQGTAYVTFVVEQDGSLTNIEILRGVSGGAGCDKEALRLVKLMPKWNAGKQNGKTVRVQYNLPIKFHIR